MPKPPLCNQQREYASYPGYSGNTETCRICRQPTDYHYRPHPFTTAVSNERGWEFFAEMKRWFELVRLEKVSEVRAETWDGSLFQRNNHYYFPIPYQQIELTQWTNNGY